MAPRVRQGVSSEGLRQHDGDGSYQFVLNDPVTESIMNGNTKNKRIWGKGGKAHSVSSKLSSTIQPQGCILSTSSIHSSGSSMFDLSMTSVDTSLSPLDFHRNRKIQKESHVELLQHSCQESSGAVYNQVDDSCSLGQSTISTDIDESSFLDESISPTPKLEMNFASSDFHSPSKIEDCYQSRSFTSLQNKGQQPQCSTSHRSAFTVMAELLFCGCVGTSLAKDNNVATKIT